jgi:hypothetical protein
MSKQTQMRRGTQTEHETFTGAIGEVTVDTTNNTLRVHDGVNVGGTHALNDLSQAYIFETVDGALGYKQSTIVFPIGKTIHLNDRDADFTVIAGTGTANTFDIIASTVVTQSLDLTSADVFNVRHYGAIGDGVTNDTAAFEAARGDLSKPRELYVPQSTVSHLLVNFQMGKECIIRGGGRYISNIKGNGVDPVLLFGNGLESTWRTNQLIDVGIENVGAPCIVGNYSPNYIIRNCNIRSTGGDGTFSAVDFVLAPRGEFSNNICAIVGGGWALSLRDNCNGQTVHHNIMTGGNAGGAIKVGKSSVVSIKWNVIESGFDGIHVASHTGTGEGICQSVEIDDNYFEQIRNPIVLGTAFIVKGWSVKRTLVSNADISTASQAYKFGRVFNGEFSENVTVVKSGGSENFIEFVLNQNNDRQGNVFKKGRLEGTPANLISYTGALANDASTKQNLGGYNYLDFISLSSTESFKEYLSPTFTGNVGTSTVAWINEVILELGGKIFGVEVIEKQGDLTGAVLEVGDNADPNRLVNLALNSTTYSFGYYDIPLTHPTNHIRKQNKNLVRNIAGSGTGTYRVKITYRAS